jgi:hypothetical protein
MRMAKGKYTVYLADDDKLLCNKLVEHVKYMEAHTECSASYAPWWAYDDEKEEIIHGYFEVDEVQVFNKSAPLDLYNFMVKKLIFPEMVVYRTDCLHKVMLYFPDAAVNIFQMAYGLLKQGDVVFQTEPFYLEVATVKSRFNQTARMNIEVNLSGLDRTRASLEITFQRILLDLGYKKIPDDMRLNMHEMLLKYSVNRLIVAFNRYLQKENYLLASECAQRVMLWQGEFKEDRGIAEVNSEIFLTVGLQAVIEQFRGITWLEKLFICEFKNGDKMLGFVDRLYPDVSAELATVQEVLDYPNPELAFVVVRTDKEKIHFLDSGILPGNVVSLEEWSEFYQIMPSKHNFDDI